MIDILLNVFFSNEFFIIMCCFGCIAVYTLIKIYNDKWEGN